MGSKTTNIDDPYLSKIIDGCRLDRKLGQGGMGIAYLATHVDLNRPFVIKLLNPALTSSEDTVQRFYREAQSVAKLNHENIVAIQNVGRDGEYYFIRMEYVDGVTLESIVRSRKKLPWPIATRIMAKTAHALAHAHGKGIIHRDIKPENIMFSEDGETVKVMDFGLAKQVKNATKVSVTGQIVGTPFFMSPEQAGGKATDERSDLYSLGVTYYYMLSGVKPFNGKNLQEIFLKHFFYTPESPKIYTPDLPQEVCDIIRKCLKKKKAERYQSAEELVKDLERVQQDWGEGGVAAVDPGKATQFLDLRTPTEQESRDIAAAMSQANQDLSDPTLRTTPEEAAYLDFRSDAGVDPGAATIPDDDPDDDDSEHSQTVVRAGGPFEAPPLDPDSDDAPTIVRQASPFEGGATGIQGYDQTQPARISGDVSQVAESVVDDDDDFDGEATVVRSGETDLGFTYSEAVGEDDESPTLVSEVEPFGRHSGTFRGPAQPGGDTVVKPQARDGETLVSGGRPSAPARDDEEDFGATQVRERSPFNTTDIRSPGAEETLVRGRSDLDHDATVVRGGPRVDNDATVVRGAPRLDDDATLVRRPGGGHDDNATVVRGGLPGDVAGDTVVRGGAGSASGTFVGREMFPESEDAATYVQGADELQDDPGDDTSVTRKALAETGRFQPLTGEDVPDYSQYEDYGDYAASMPEEAGAAADPMAALGDSGSITQQIPGREEGGTTEVRTPSRPGSDEASRSRTGVETVSFRKASALFGSGEVARPKLTEAKPEEAPAPAAPSLADRLPIPPAVLAAIAVVLLVGGGIYMTLSSQAKAHLTEIEQTASGAQSLPTKVKLEGLEGEKLIAAHKRQLIQVQGKIDRLRAVVADLSKEIGAASILMDVERLVSLKSELEKDLDALAAKVPELELELRKAERGETGVAGAPGDPKEPETPIGPALEPELQAALEAQLEKAQASIDAGDLAAGAVAMLALQDRIEAMDEARRSALKGFSEKVRVPIRVTSTPSGAEVFLDDAAEPAGKTPLTLSLRPRQEAKLRVSRSHFEEARLTVVADGFRDLAAPLQRERAFRFAMPVGKVPQLGSQVQAETKPIIEVTPRAELGVERPLRALYAVSREGLLRAFSLSTPEGLWQKPTLVGFYGDPLPRPSFLAAPRAVFCTSAGVLNRDRVRKVGATEEAAYYTVCAVDPDDGALLWDHDTGSPCQTSPIYASVPVEGQDKDQAVLVVGLLDGRVLFLDPEIGQPLKDSEGRARAFQCRGQVLGSPAVSGRYALVGASDNRLYAIDWLASPPSLAGFVDLPDDVAVGPVAIDGGFLVGTNKGSLHAVKLTARGELELQWSTPGTGRAIVGEPVFAENRIFYADGAQLLAIERASGEPVTGWKAEVEGSVTQPAFGGAGDLYVGTSLGELIAFDSLSGEVLWRYTCRREDSSAVDLRSAPLIVKTERFGDVVLVISRDGWVFGLAR